MKESSKPHLRIEFEGFPRLYWQGEVLASLRMVKAQALLFYVVTENRLHGQSVFPKEKLVDLLWPGMPLSSGLQNLRQAIYRIRKEIPLEDDHGHFLLTTRQQVTLRAEKSISTDLDQWVSGTAFSVGQEPNDWIVPAPPFLDHFSVPDSSHFDEWVDQTRMALREKKSKLLSHWMKDTTKHPDTRLAAARHLLTLNPYDEQVLSDCAQLLQKVGRHQELKHVYRVFAERLKNDLDQVPTVQLSQFLSEEVPAVGSDQPTVGDARFSSALAKKYGIWLGLFLLIAFWLGGQYLPKKAEARELRIAVLPFENLTGNDFLAEGLTDEIIIALSKVEELTTISRQSSSQYRNTEKSIGQIGDELGVPYLLKGKLSERDGDWYVQVELISAEDGRIVWTDGFRQKQEKIFLFQQNISQEVIRNLKGSLALEDASLITPSTSNFEAYNAYLQGRFHFYQATPEGLKASVEFYKKAIDIDPDFKRAYVALAWSYTTMAGSWGDQRAEDMFPLVREALDAFAGDPGLEAYYYHTMGWMSFWLLDMEQAEGYMRKAISLNPNIEFSVSSLAMFLCLRGQFEESEKIALEGLVISPNFFWNYFVLGQTYYYAGDWDKAEEALDKALGLFPEHAASIGLKANLFTLQGKPEQAVDYLEEQMGGTSAEEWPANLTGALGLSYVAMEDLETAYGLVEVLVGRHKAEEKYCGYYAAQIYAYAGQDGMALSLLEESLDQNDNELNWVGVDYAFRELHENPRFREILSSSLK